MTRRTKAIAAATIVVVIIAAYLMTAKCGPSKEERLEENARLLAKDGHYAEAIAILQPLANEPNNPQAAQAKDQILLYRGFLEAEEKKARRTAKDEMLAIARALLDAQSRGALYPASLDELDPSRTLPRSDPWKRPYQYEPSPDRKRYRLGCLGQDGNPGGEGDDRDLLIVDGEFVKDLKWEDR